MNGNIFVLKYHKYTSDQLNVTTGELYNISFVLSKFDKKYVNKGHYVIISINHRLKVWYVVSV